MTQPTLGRPLHEPYLRHHEIVATDDGFGVAIFVPKKAQAGRLTAQGHSALVEARGQGIAGLSQPAFEVGKSWVRARGNRGRHRSTHRIVPRSDAVRPRPRPEARHCGA